VRRIWVLMAVAFVDMIGLMMIVPLLPLYAKSLGAAPTTIGLLWAAFPVAQLASSPIWGRVSDRHGRRPALLIGLAGSVVAYVVFGFAHAVWLLFVARFAQGLGGGTTGVAQAYVADSVPPHERAKALGWLSAATSAGVIIGPALGSLAHNLGAAAPGLLAAGLIGVNWAFAWRWLPESRVKPVGESARQRRSRSIRHAVWDVARHPGEPVSRLIWIYAIAMLPYNAVGLVFSLYLSERFSITANEIGYFFIVFGAVGVLMRSTVVGPMNERLGEVRTMRLGATLYGLGFVLLPLAPTLPLFVICQLLLPLGTALLFPATSALVSHRAHHEEFGLTLGVQQAFRGVSAILGPILAGAAYQGLGRSVPFFGCAAAIAVALTLAAREPTDAPAPAPARPQPEPGS